MNIAAIERLNDRMSALEEWIALSRFGHGAKILQVIKSPS